MDKHKFEFKDGGFRLEVGIAAPEIYRDGGDLPKFVAGIIDTAATLSVVSPLLIKVLKSPQVGYAPVSFAGGASLYLPTHLVLFRIGGAASKSPWIQSEVVVTTPATPETDVIIGQDMLLKCDMKWNGGMKSGTISS